MHSFTRDDIEARLNRDNPWWESEGPSAFPNSDMRRRVYFDSFKSLALNRKVKRAAILLGPRRVGKTVMIQQVIEDAAKEGWPRENILYVSIDTPLYSGISLEEFLSFLPSRGRGEECLVAFDEIQYLRDWQVHLKDLVDAYPNVKFIASGSAAAALSLQSRESGAGRFSDFMLPPLTFSEFLDFSGQDDLAQMDETHRVHCQDIDALNSAFIDYLNYGGYPEAVLIDEIRKNQEQFISKDIIEKVLLKDLPTLYGIGNTQELNKLFTFLAYNAGQEASYENISQESGVNKPLVRKYIEYLESAFLIIKLPTVNDTCRTMQRERNFKVYLSNPSMRAALFSPVEPSDGQLIGHLAESAVFSQWQHSFAFKQLRYARWRNEGEVDVVFLSSANDRPVWIGEVKWSDRAAKSFYSETKAMKVLMEKHPSVKYGFFTTRTYEAKQVLCGKRVDVWPTAAYCYMVGKNATSPDALNFKMRRFDDHPGDDELEDEPTEEEAA
jgi:predicted AAA+ superfamily ATPase